MESEQELVVKFQALVGHELLKLARSGDGNRAKVVLSDLAALPSFVKKLSVRSALAPDTPAAVLARRSRGLEEEIASLIGVALRLRWLVPAVDSRPLVRLVEPIVDSWAIDRALAADKASKTENPPSREGARLLAVSGTDAGSLIELSKGAPISVGRSSRADLAMTDASVSRRHLGVYWAGSNFEAIDYLSTNGTKIGGRHLELPRSLAAGDILEVGEIRVVYLEEETAAERLLSEFRETYRDPEQLEERLATRKPRAKPPARRALSSEPIKVQTPSEESFVGLTDSEVLWAEGYVDRLAKHNAPDEPHFHRVLARRALDRWKAEKGKHASSKQEDVPPPPDSVLGIPLAREIAMALKSHDMAGPYRGHVEIVQRKGTWELRGSRPILEAMQVRLIRLADELEADDPLAFSCVKAWDAIDNSLRRKWRKRPN